MVLEDNLGSRALQDMDESTQESGLTAPSPPTHKRGKRAGLLFPPLGSLTSASVLTSPPDTSVCTKLPSFFSIIMSATSPPEPAPSTGGQTFPSSPYTVADSPPTISSSPPPTSPLRCAPALHSAPGFPTLHYPTPPASYHRRGSIDTSNRLSDKCAAALILGMSIGDREDVEDDLRLEKYPWGMVRS